MEEILKDIKGYEGTYKISNLGNIYVRRKERVKGGLKKTGIHKDTGYSTVCLTKDNKQRTFYVHRLVAEHFLEKIDGKPFVNHKDFNKQNNAVSNLEYVSRMENYEHYLNNNKDYPEQWLPRKVGQYTLDGELIRVYSSVSRAVKLNKNTHISEVCQGKRRQAKGYLWRYVD